MQAVFETIVALVSALAVGVLARFGVDATPRPPTSHAEKVVARTPAKRPAANPAGPVRKTDECPHGETTRANLV